MRVNIPKPCTENWGEMSPTQRGAFCQTCAVDVIDFSNKNPEEVKATLKANIGKHMCGRFKKSQLSDLSRTYQIWENQSTKTFQSKFLWACMIAFGLTLFTGCENSNAQELMLNALNESQATLVNTDSLQANSDTTLTDTTSIQKNNVEPSAIIKGDFDDSEPEIMWLGEPAIEFDDFDETELTQCEQTVEDTTQITIPDKVPAPVEYIKGKFAAPPRFSDYLADTVKIETLPPAIETETIQAMAFPNPSTGLSTLKVNTSEPDHYAIELYNLEGSKISTIYAGKIGRSEQFFELDLSNYPSGIYLVKITSDYVAHALKINKVN
jgi:hypothetical protein